MYSFERSLMKFLLLLLGCMSLTSFFFESNFDCKIPKGQKCKSLFANFFAQKPWIS
ncbi:conjugative transfer protein [Orientia tsutsugamushi str. Boryong]|uniref:Conjugative transfer protein n=1 Tax=Orientia tsutsugamushi (strain Boryong) TaxID=357244 RepID=A5CF86_ORITB|nr:conjugative transfer protein [Orientia tsutsugamushi str. Boryong]